MGIRLRDNKRYGIFKADSSIGEIEIEISVYGFGEKITVTQNGKVKCTADTLNDDDCYDETDNEIILYNVRVKKPFVRCLKRY